MDTTAELNTEESLSSGAAMAADNAPPESTGAEVGQAPAPSVSEPVPSHEPEATAKGGEAVPAEPASPKLDLISFFPASERAPRIEAAPPKAPRNFVAPGLVGLALLFLLGAGAVYEQMHQSARLAAKVRQNEHLVSTVSNLTERLDAIERRARPRGDRRRAKASRRDETGGLRDARRQRRGFATHRPGRSRRARPGTRLDKLAERIDHEALSRFADHRGSARQIGKEGRLADCRRGRPDHDASSRFADLAARLDKLERKAASPTVAVVAPDHDASPRFADFPARLDKLEKRAASPTVAGSPRPRRPSRSRFRRKSTPTFRTKRPPPSRNRSLRSEATPSSLSATDSPRSGAARARSRWALAT